MKIAFEVPTKHGVIDLEYPGADFPHLPQVGQEMMFLGIKDEDSKYRVGKTWWHVVSRGDGEEDDEEDPVTFMVDLVRVEKNETTTNL